MSSKDLRRGLQMSISIACSLLWSPACTLPGLPDAGKVYVERWAETQGSEKDAADIVAVFNRAEEALHAGDLAGII